MHLLEINISSLCWSISVGHIVEAGLFCNDDFCRLSVDSCTYTLFQARCLEQR